MTTGNTKTCSKYRCSRIAALLMVAAMSIMDQALCQTRETKVKLGVDVLRANGFSILKGKRVGLITNPTGIAADMQATVDVLWNAEATKLVALFGPEHGVRGDIEAGKYVESFVDQKTNLPVYSLYGKTRKPTKEMLQGSNTETANGTNARFGPTKLDNTPHFTFVNGKKVETYFSPSDKTTTAIVRAINSANNNIFFGLFSFTRDEIGAEIIARKNAGVIVRGIIDNISDAGSEYSPLLSAAVDVRKAGHSVVTGDFHHKYGVVDPFHDASDPVVVTGSHNWSTSAESDNDENTLLIHSGEMARQFVQEFGKRYQESGGTGPILKVEQIGSVPDKMRLSQNYPNPFNPSTSIEFQLPQRMLVMLSVFDVLGRQVATLLNEEKQAGSYRVTWDASGLPSGIYFYRMQTPSYSETRKMMLMR